MNTSYDEDAFPSAQEPMDTATNVTPKTVTDLEPLSGGKDESVIKDVEMTKRESLSGAAEQKGCFYTKCYSPMCRNPGSEQISESLKCYSPSCPHKVCVGYSVVFLCIHLYKCILYTASMNCIHMEISPHSVFEYAHCFDYSVCTEQ